ncbi:hypothetical protein [Pantoea agglomerans]|jgi:hypothetical protein|uniref:hypothetical protein n=1 Tax=Enterobacter agglomerans TaxID=549 RepID=UPI002164F108|nr:hypothetical protein [Pantoea agglomerans]UVV71779.1 hypothetical protein NYF24_13125 [Pantoea agglomerans]
MNNFSLTTAEFERLLKVFGWLLGITGLVIFFIQWYFFRQSIPSAAWKAFSSSLGFCVFSFGVFTKLAWRWRRLAKWMNRPLVHGVWVGELRSDYGAVAGEQLVVPIFFVIRQTYLTLSIQSFTERQEGESRLEALLRSSKTDVTRLCYVFELRKVFSGAHSITSGAGELKLAGDQLSLNGTYWTNTPTHGEISLRLVTRDCEGISSYQEAKNAR